MSKETWSKVLSIVITAAIALAAVFGYNVIVVQPQMEALEAELAAVAPGGEDVGSRAVGDTNFTNVVASGDITAGDDLVVGDDVTIAGSLEVTGGVTGTNVLTTGDQTIAGVKTFSTAIAVGAVTGPVTITGPTAVATATPAAIVNNLGAANNAFEVRDSATPVFVVGNAGAVTMSGALAADNGITVDSTMFTVANTTGAVTMAGGYGSTGCTVAETGALSCDGVITGASTLALTGAATLSAGATVAGGDVTLSADATGGNAGAVNQFIGVPRIKLIGGAQGTNPGSQTIALLDDSPNGEWAPAVDDVTEALDTTYYRIGSASYKAIFAAGADEDDGIVDAALGASAAWDDMESFGAWVRVSSAVTDTLQAGDLQLVLTDDGGARKFNLPAVATTDTWTWIEVNIATGDLSAVSDVAITLTAQGATNLEAFDFWIDIAYVWDSVDEEALGVAIQTDGVLGVINTESGAQLVEFTDYIVHYESGVDFVVYITDQSSADVAILAAY